MGSRKKLRAFVRERVASGELPAQHPDSPRPITQGPLVMEVRIGTVAGARCVLCGEFGPHVSYTYLGGRIVRLHTACDAAWRGEATTRE